MTTVLSIITQSYRESNLIGLGVTPNDKEQAEALPLLSALVGSAVGFAIGEQLADWPIGEVGVVYGRAWNQTLWNRPPAGTRLLARSGTPQTVYLQANPSNGARMALVDVSQALETAPITIDANGVLIEGQPTLVINSAAEPIEWMYDAETANWTRWSAIAIDGDMPFPAKFDSYWITKLAMRLNPRYGRAIQAESASELATIEARIRAAYRQNVVTAADLAVQLLSRQSYERWRNDRINQPTGWMN